MYALLLNKQADAESLTDKGKKILRCLRMKKEGSKNLSPGLL
jgi:hypothetical protein